MATVLDVKHLLVVTTFTLIFLAVTIAVAYLTRSGLAVAALMGGLAVAFVALGLVRARVQRGDTSLVLEQPRLQGRRKRTGHS